jgi:predicted metalloprotease
MRWRGRRKSSNIEDRRSAGAGGGFRRMGGRRTGGVGIGMIAVVFIGSLIFGFNPMTVLNMLGGGGLPVGGGQSVQTSAPSAESDELTQFVSVVLADTEDVWNGVFQQAGERYREPRLVLFSGSTQSACGFAQSASGPFYCPGDEKVYIDLAFYRQLKTQFQAPGDFAQAYVVAHEVGHHVQNLMGILPKFNEIRRRVSKEEANRLSVRIELQADCFAGIWAHNTAKQGILEQGDLREAMNAAAQIGDDMIQKRTQGYVVPESFSHGSAEQRQRWFRIGLEQGSVNACDTLNASRV